jgi:Uma2 family endonuclease
MVARDLSHATPRRLTRAEYDRMGELQFFRGERVELIHGTVVRMSPIGPSHSSMVGRLNELLLPRLLGRATVRIQQPFIAHDDSEPEPDVAIVPSGRYNDRHPDSALLIVEVAESSLAYDRETKGLLYAASGVPEYWLVDVGGRAVEVYRNPEGGRYALARRALGGESLSPSAFPDLVIALSDIGI